MINKAVSKVEVGNILKCKNDGLYYAVNHILEEEEGINFYFKYLGYVRSRGMKKMFENIFNEVSVFTKEEIPTFIFE